MEPIGKIQRWVKGEVQIQVIHPNVIKAYNEGMGRVDMMDRLPESYRPPSTMKKCRFSLFVNIVNVSVVAAWRLFKRANPNSKVMHLEFRSYITLVLIKSADQTRINRERTMARELTVEIKTDKSDHKSGPALQGRCVVCKRNTRLKCKKCGLILHHDKGTVCFDVYHKNL